MAINNQFIKDFKVNKLISELDLSLNEINNFPPFWQQRKPNELKKIDFS